jgi:hypothetical protein
MSHGDHSEVQSRAQREGIVAAFACLASTLLLLKIAPMMRWLHWGWAGSLVGALVPLALTFVLLYRSSIHREMIRLARVAYVFLISISIYAGVAFAIGMIIFFAIIFADPARGQPGH